MLGTTRTMSKGHRMRWLLEFGDEPVSLLNLLDTWAASEFNWGKAIDDGYLEEAGYNVVKLTTKGRDFTHEDKDE